MFYGLFQIAPVRLYFLRVFLPSRTAAELYWVPARPLREGCRGFVDPLLPGARQSVSRSQELTAGWRRDLAFEHLLAGPNPWAWRATPTTTSIRDKSQTKAPGKRVVHDPCLRGVPGYAELSRMWASRFELGVRFSLFAAVLSAACDRPELKDSTSLEYAADSGHAEDSAQASVGPDERRHDRERMAVAVLHGSSTWFERKRADAELPKVRWAANCWIHRACPAPRAMPACKAGERAQSWEELRGRAKQLSGSIVAVSGQLDLSAEMVQVPSACHLGACCHRLGTSVVLDNRGTAVDLENSEHALGLGDYECYGDDSKGCCNVVADGRAVIAKGRLVETGGRVELHEPLWELREGSLCTLPVTSIGKR